MLGERVLAGRHTQPGLLLSSPPGSANTTYLDRILIKGQPPVEGNTVDVVELLPCSTVISQVTSFFASGAMANVLTAASDTGALGGTARRWHALWRPRAGRAAAAPGFPPVTAADSPPLPPGSAPTAGSPESICNAALFACPGELFPYSSMLECISFISTLPATCNDGVHTLQVLSCSPRGPFLVHAASSAALWWDVY